MLGKSTDIRIRHPYLHENQARNSYSYSISIPKLIINIEEFCTAKKYNGGTVSAELGLGHKSRMHYSVG
uniref:Uncharacterized protein n=1 Tax=Meloidogyne enterolobii TaxID=390850 RepID=A0A6V7VPN5_MELEN|nr:unnamed protein product [Meloidogyne enterolobii]